MSPSPFSYTSPTWFSFGFETTSLQPHYPSLSMPSSSCVSSSPSPVFSPSSLPIPLPLPLSSCCPLEETFFSLFYSERSTFWKHLSEVTSLWRSLFWSSSPLSDGFCDFLSSCYQAATGEGSLLLSSEELNSKIAEATSVLDNTFFSIAWRLQNSSSFLFSSFTSPVLSFTDFPLSTDYEEETNKRLSSIFVSLLECLNRNQEDNLLQGVFWLACTTGNEWVVHALLDHPGINPGAHDHVALEWAASNGHVNVTKKLLESSRVDPTTNQNAALRYSATNGHSGVVQVLLADPRVDPTSLENEALRTASERGHTEAVKLLLKDRRVSPSLGYNFCLKWAWKGRHFSVIQLLLDDDRIMEKRRTQQFLETPLLFPSPTTTPSTSPISTPYSSLSSSPVETSFFSPVFEATSSSAPVLLPICSSSSVPLSLGSSPSSCRVVSESR